MISLGIPWLPLLVLVLGGMVLPGAGYAQRPSDGELTLELLQRIERLESEVRQIRGELEIFRHQLEQQEHDVAADDPSADDGRPPAADWTEADWPAKADDPPTSASSSMDDEVAAAVTGTERTDFDTALNEFREGRFREAIMKFQQFLGDYPESGLAGDARYWLGESYYLRRDYDAAKEAFIELGLRDPQSVRLPDALLKLGYLYGEQGDTARARNVLQKLVQVYPDTQAASLAERRLRSLR